MLLALLTACTDYNLEGNKTPKDVDTGEAPVEDSPVQESETADTGDSGVVVETGDSDVATEAVYISTGPTLYSYEPSTNTATRVGDYMDGGTRVTEMTDIAIDLSGHVYGASWSTLYAIDATNAQVSEVATMDQSFNALTFLSDGTLVGAAGDAVYRVDTSTGRTTPIARSTGFTTSGDIVGLPDGLLYWTVEGGDRLVVVDPTTGDATLVGNIGVPTLYGVGYTNGLLYGFSSAGRAVTIDPATGAATANQSLPGTWYGATTNPVVW